MTTRDRIHRRMAAGPNPREFTAYHLSQDLYLTPNLVRRHLRDLEAAGLVTRRPGRGGEYLWRAT